MASDQPEAYLRSSRFDEDQHEDIRKCVKQTLEREGFKVLTARNSVEALVIAADYPLAIDVFITESASRVYQNGMELAARAADPDYRISETA